MLKRGISLIILIITIVVMIIIAGATIIITNNDGIIDKANLAVDKTEVSTYYDQLEDSVLQRMQEDISFDRDSLNADWDGSGDSDIRTWIPNIDDKYNGKLEITNGQLEILPVN